MAILIPSFIQRNTRLLCNLICLQNFSFSGWTREWKLDELRWRADRIHISKCNFSFAKPSKSRLQELRSKLSMSSGTFDSTLSVNMTWTAHQISSRAFFKTSVTFPPFDGRQFHKNNSSLIQVCSFLSFTITGFSFVYWFDDNDWMTESIKIYLEAKYLCSDDHDGTLALNITV